MNYCLLYDVIGLIVVYCIVEDGWIVVIEDVVFWYFNFIEDDKGILFVKVIGKRMIKDVFVDVIMIMIKDF